MRGSNVLGIIFANDDDGVLSDITGIRSMASVPFGGGYRLVDFVLSNLVNAGVAKVGVLTNNNYQSLMDHIGSGRPWDLSRKEEGLYLLPPFNQEAVDNYNAGSVGALKNIMQFLEKSKEEYVFLTVCSYVANLDLRQAFNFHERSGADVTLLTCTGNVPRLRDVPLVQTAENGKITKLRIADENDETGTFGIKALMIGKALLQRLIREAFSQGRSSVTRDILLKNADRLNMYSYPIDTFCPVIDGLKGYFAANFALLQPENYDALFRADRPVLTKVYEDMPVVYGLGSDVKNSLIADGCIIDGEVENCILFRECRVEKGAVVKNSVLMPRSFIGENAMLNYCITDKAASVRPGKTLSGADSFPIYIGKEIQI
ncbi:MAG: glucose-1-phosphate adenylyltransferase subunit GlgD [Clostridia bacterium]|nr:glucose-1-phosphate adenylyltransferase subunit GlgD [Clostridia bacterium]